MNFLDLADRVDLERFAHDFFGDLYDESRDDLVLISDLLNVASIERPRNASVNRIRALYVEARWKLKRRVSA